MTTSGTGLLLDRDTGGFIFSRRWCGQSSPVSRESPGKVRYVFKTGLTVFHTFSHILTSCFPISAFNTSLNIKGQPIVNDVTDAEEFSKHYGIKVFTTDD